MRCLVTGGAGFIGANLVRALERCGAQVSVLDDLSTGFESNLSGTSCDLVVGSILDRHLVEAIVKHVDAVVHLAARASVPRSLADPEASHHANATGTLTVLEAVRSTDQPIHVIVASSSSVYGANPASPKSEVLRPMPISPYAVSKLAAESYATAYSACFGIPTLPLRFFNVFGPLQSPDHAYAAVIPAFAKAMLSGEAPSVFGDGRQTRDFTFVGTVTDVLVRALERRITSGPTNVAFGIETSLRDVLTMMRELVGRPVPDAVFLEERKGDVRHSVADSAHLRALLPDVQPKPLREGLRATLGWMQEHLDGAQSERSG